MLNTDTKDVACMTCGKMAGPIYRFPVRDVWISSLKRWMPALESVELLVCKRCTDNFMGARPISFEAVPMRPKIAEPLSPHEQQARAKLRALLKRRP